MRGLFVIFSFFIFMGKAEAQPKNAPAKQIDYKKTGAPLPPFVLEKTAGGTLTNTNLKKGKPVMLMLFSPQCDHCEHMVDSLKKLEARFKNTQLLMIAEGRNKDFMKGFIEKTGIGNDPFFKNIGIEKGNLIFYIYNYKLLPQINFYDEHYKLVRTFSGNSPMDSVKMFIR